MYKGNSIRWEGPGWYARAVGPDGIDRWIKVADEATEGEASREARYKGLGTPRFLADASTFDKVE